MSYSVGMTKSPAKICGTTPRTLNASTAPQYVSFKDLGVLSERKLTNSKIYETCHWIIRFPESADYDNLRSSISINFKEIKDADVYLFWGTRKDPISLMEAGGTAAVGSPIYLPLGGQIVIVSQTKRDKLNSSIDFSFAINAVNAPWWDKIGNTYFWLAVVGTIILLVSLVSGCYGGFCCCCCTCGPYAKKEGSGKIFNDNKADFDPNGATQNEEYLESGSGSEIGEQLYGYGKPMGDRKDGDVYINDDTDLFGS